MFPRLLVHGIGSCAEWAFLTCYERDSVYCVNRLQPLLKYEFFWSLHLLSLVHCFIADGHRRVEVDAALMIIT